MPTGTLYVSEERISVEEAVRAYTQDIFAADPLNRAKTRVTLTLVGGKIVYAAP